LARLAIIEWESLMVDVAFAAQERASLQRLSAGVSTALVTLASRLALLKLEKIALQEPIVQLQQRLTALMQSQAEAVAKAEEAAAKKAAGWHLVFAIIAAVVIAVVACVLAAVTFGAATGGTIGLIVGAIAAAIEGQAPFLAAAANRGHPLAAEFASILAQMAAALRNFAREQEQDRRAAIARLLAELDQTVTKMERLPRRVAMLKGPCPGNPDAAFATCDELQRSLGGLAGALQRGPHVDLRPVISGLTASQETLTRALTTLRPVRGG
jgi:hypothetical protein